MTAAELSARLERIRAGAPRRSPNVRVLAAFAPNTGCGLAALGFAAGVDFDRLLVGTDFAAPFGQSPFAFERGNRFEKMLRENGHAKAHKLLQQVGFRREEGLTVNLRENYPRTKEGMKRRADVTRGVIQAILEARAGAPNLIDGAVLQTTIAGVRASFEADAIAARIAGVLRAGEVKSFPVVDGRTDPDKLAAALDQVAFYLLLLRRLVDELGYPLDRVSREALLITPKNVGLEPMISMQDVGRRIDRAERLLARVRDAAEVIDMVPNRMGFGVAGDSKQETDKRLDALHELADQVGTDYRPDCLSTCGNAFFCRERAFKVASPALIGPQAVRLLPCVRSLDRAAELAGGARPRDEEKPVAAQLVRAERLYAQAANATTGGEQRRAAR